MSKTTSKTITEPVDLLVLRDDLTIDQIEARAGLMYAGTGLRHRGLAHYLHFVDRRGLYQAGGYRSTTAWAAARIGMSTREARDLLNVGRRLPELPAIDRAFIEGRLWWTKVRELVKVASPDHEEKWLEQALQLTCDELAHEVRLSKPGQPPRCRDDRKGLPEVRMRVEASVPPDVYAMSEQVQRKASDEAGRQIQGWEALQAAMEAYLADEDGDGDGPRRRRVNSPYTVVVSDGKDADGNAVVHTDDGPVPITPQTLDLLTCDGHHVSYETPNGKARRGIPDGLRRRVLARDGYRCRRCRSRNSLHEHHIIPESEGGPTDYWNLLTLCRYCHTLTHAGFIVIEGSLEKGTLRFLDRQGRVLDGADVVPAPAYEQMTGGEVTVLEVPDLPEPTEAESGTACRPPVPTARLDDLIGQREVVGELALSIDVARRLGEPLGHTLLAGAPGLGKTTLARAVAGEMGARLHATTGGLLQSPADLLAALAGLGPGDVLFVDEIHAMPKAVAEVLHDAMDRRRVTMPIAGAPRRHGAPHSLEPFTLIGATTEPGLLTDPFLSRFENVGYLRFYEPPELAELIERAAREQGLHVEPGAASKLAAVARQTPRRALGLLTHARKRAVKAGRRVIDEALVAWMLPALGIDRLGLGPIDRRCLEVLRESRDPVALERLAQHVGIDAAALRRRHEPYLIRLGLIAITPRGRVALPLHRTGRAA